MLGFTPLRSASWISVFAAVVLTQGVPVNSASAQEQAKTIVARTRITQKQDKETVTIAEPGDVLSAVSAKDGKVLIQTAKGVEAWVVDSAVTPFADSAPIYDRLIAAQPRSSTLFLLRGHVWAERGEAERAIADYGSAIKLGVNEPGVFMSRGVFLASVGKFDEAIADYDAAIKAGAKGPGIHVNRAAAYLGKQDFERAIADYTKAIEARPDDPLGFIQRGIARRGQRDWANAVVDFSKAIELDSANLTAIGHRGFSYYSLGRHADAVKDFSRAIELSPKDAVAYNNRGFNRQMTGDFSGALSDYAKAIEYSEGKYALALQNKAWLLATCPEEKHRDGKAALTTAQQVCELREFKVYSDVKSLAAAHAELGDFDKAVERQKQVVEMSPEGEKSGEEEILKLYQAKQPFRLIISKS